LLKDGAITEETYNDRKNNLDSSRYDYQSQLLQVQNSLKNLELKRKLLEDTYIRAPINGVIKNRLLQPGQQISNGQEAFNLVVIDTLYIEIHCPQHLLSKLKTNQSLNISTKSHSSLAKVYFIDSVLEPASKTFRVRLKVNNTNGEVIPGEQVHVNIPEL
ncbi:efflux RND transporter periplasmic adaptor subunit, partial [bacterium]|nr:efflux RND transporter periplasmic adaptor subunit [bacterium]